MTTKRAFWRRNEDNGPVAEAEVVKTAPAPATRALDVGIAPDDPLLSYMQSAGGVVEVDKLSLESPAVQALRDAGVQLVVPLISQGELIGLINLGGRLSEQEYSTDDRKLLSDLATQAAPALRVAQLVRQQKLEAAERERIEQELRVARLIQQTLLPHSLPMVEGWAVDAHYQPARAVGGDFYDFVYFDDGRIGIIIADVTDKGVPAALVMATTRSILRAAAERLESPSAVLERTNNVLVPEIPPKMFVTCFYALLDTTTGELRYANAGHDLPFHYSDGKVTEMRATGMPLGLLPGMRYEEKWAHLEAGDYILLYSDGLAEAHNPQGEMYGFPRLQATLQEQTTSADGLTHFLLKQLADFTGEGWEQEDDVTMVTVQRNPIPKGNGDDRLLGAFDLPSAPGGEREAMARVSALAAELLPQKRLERLETAVAEATMNAMEHGNRYDAQKPAHIEVYASSSALRVLITDLGGGAPIPDAEKPDLEAKLAGLQTPRGWGLFLIQSMVDDMNVTSDERHHTIELVMALGEPEQSAEAAPIE